MNHIILYQPGFGGNFLSNLFSLDLSTVPYCNPHHTYPITINDRLELYKSVQLEDDRLKVKPFISREFDYHASWHSKIRLVKKFKNQVHRVESTHIIAEPLLITTNNKYFIAELSYNNFSNFWLVYSKQQWGGFPALTVDMIEHEIKIKTTLPHSLINIDAFLNVDTWEYEYKRVNELMGLPDYLDLAYILYKAWYDNRVAPLKDKFKLITNHDKYLTLRCWAETNGEIHWRRFYNEVRTGSTWPPCDYEEDFYKLPSYIQKDLVNLHGYNPKPLL
tara:strand:+ start:37 stop:864 length:828 start_codon:yes stop_codon:yes gene_type:complete